ncbi:MAG TPA: ABC transporter permease, partial [Anaerolineae bacterium]|nr:ABC transporter permease [Anaerolineae bacterium]
MNAPDTTIATSTHAEISPLRMALRNLFRQRSAIVGLVALLILLLTAIFAPVITTYSPVESMFGRADHEGIRKRAKPCIHLLGCPDDQPQHLMGLDGNARDVFSRIVYGTRISLRVGFVVVAFALSIGTFLGAIAGYSGGWLDNIIMRIMDVQLAFPSLLLAIAISFVVRGIDPTNACGSWEGCKSIVLRLFGDSIDPLNGAMLAISIVTIPHYARVVRSVVLSTRELGYVEAATASGATYFRILFLSILPNAIAPLIVQGTLGVGTAIIDAAALSFLGLGAQEPTPEWGQMLGREFNQLFSAPHLVLFPGLAITITVLAFNLLGDGLRDALDPR